MTDFDFGVGAALSFGPAGLLGPDDFYPLCRSAAIHVGRPLTIAELARGRSRDDQPAHHPMTHGAPDRMKLRTPMSLKSQSDSIGDLKQDKAVPVP